MYVAAASANPINLALAAMIFITGLLCMAFTTYTFVVKRKVESPQSAVPFLPLEAFIVTLTVFFLAQFVAGIGVAIAILASGHSAAEISSILSANPWATFGFVAITETITISLTYLFLRRRQVGFRAVGINRFKFIYIAYALCGYAVFFVSYIIAIAIARALFHIDLGQKQELGFDVATTGAGLLPIFLSLVILPPLTEEIVVRGFLFGGLRTRISFWASALIASLLFAAAHLSEGSAGSGPLWVAAIDTFVLSMVLCFLREKTRSLWPSILVHGLNNLVAFMVLFNIAHYLR